MKLQILANPGENMLVCQEEDRIVDNNSDEMILSNMNAFFKGRLALYCLLSSIDLVPGDEVILPAYTCVVVPNAVLYIGAQPVYVDIELDSFSVNPKLVEAALSPSVKAVLCQNTYGLSAHVDEIVALCKERGIWSIEDCTHGFGGTYKGKPNGSYCDAAFYSSQWNMRFLCIVKDCVSIFDEEWIL